MLLVLHDEAGKIHAIIPNGVRKGNDVYVGKTKVVAGTKLKSTMVPDQDTSHLYDENGVLVGTLQDLRLFTSEEKLQLIDRETEQKINKELHAFAPWGEQIGILRDQLVHVLNALGIEPTPEFAQLNKIAIKEIEMAREKKEAENAQDDTA